MSTRYRKGRRNVGAHPAEQIREKNTAFEKREETKIKISGKRLWLFRFIAIIVIPAVLILAVELGLRAAGYGYDAQAIISRDINGQKAYCDNVKFGWLFFPPNIAREFNPFVIPSKKPENTYRIFIFGSSAARGEPDPAYSFSRILDCILTDQYPGINFEVINTAMTAINSHVVVRIADDCAKFEPDLFVVYMGNNEVIGPYGAGTVFAPLSDNLLLVHLGITFRGTKIGQLLTNLVQTVNPKDISKAWGGMGMFLENQISADDQRLQIVYKNFEKNLESIVKTVQKRKASIILSTVASNLKDCPPFASLHRSDITEIDKNKFEALYKDAREIDKQGKYSEALEKYLEAESIDSRFAELQYCIGRCCYLLGQYDQAKERFVKARELDSVRLRADSMINEIIKETAQNAGPGVYLADAVVRFEEQSPHKIPGSELFYEHVHPNFRGNYLLAKSIFEQIETLLPERIKNPKSPQPQIIGEDKCMQALVFSEWDQYRVARILLNDYISQPPFTNQLYHNEQVKSLEKIVNSFKDNLNKQVISQIGTNYLSAIEERPTDWMLHWNYANYLTDALQNNMEAMKEFHKVLEFVPQFYRAHITLGNLYGQMGNFDEGFKHLNEAEKIRPYCSDIYYTMGLLYQLKTISIRKAMAAAKTYDNMKLPDQLKESTKEAQNCYKRALRLDPAHFLSSVNLSFLLADEGKINEAIKVCRKGLEYSDYSGELHYNLGCFLMQNNQKDEAIKEFQTVLKINPGFTFPKEIQDYILKKQ